MKTPAWLDEAVFYQVYPQSFLDTNGDGVGDLPGVIGKLPYIRGLGCTAIWLNPVFESPFRDAGYDVSDYRKVAARYGTNGDLKRLFRTAHEMGMRVVLDLVAGHTSNEHPWFKASASAKANRHSQWYVWAPGDVFFQESKLNVVAGYSERDNAYVPNYFYFQPSLNYGFARPEKPWQLPVDHPAVLAVRAEMRAIMRFWLDQGADGFRVDMAHSLVKNDPGKRETSRFWREVRGMFDAEYPEAVLISEWFDPPVAIRAGFHVDFVSRPSFHRLFREDPYFRAAGGGDASDFLGDFSVQLEKTRGRGLVGIPTSNHDWCRLTLGRTPDEIRVALAFLLTLPGVPFIYYGEEIGLAHGEDYSAKEGGYSRNGARRPMQWDGSRCAGFSAAPPAAHYLPLDKSPTRPNVARQETDPDSILRLTRKLLALRKSEPALGNTGKFEALPYREGDYPLAFVRSKGRSKILVAVNPARDPSVLRIPSGWRIEPLLSRNINHSSKPDRVSMSGLSFGIWKVSA
jgi:maltose alpha-D-glucosyltransferase/alpha-amylase